MKKADGYYHNGYMATSGAVRQAVSVHKWAGRIMYELQTEFTDGGYNIVPVDKMRLVEKRLESAVTELRMASLILMDIMTEDLEG